MSTLAENINAVEFDHPFAIYNGQVIEDIPGVYVPSVYNSDEADIDIDSAYWVALSDGWTGQYGYNGPVMHPSEYIGEFIANRLEEIAEDYKAFGITEVMDDTDADNVIGWVILGLPA
jgi:hypothetical protein